MVENGIPIRVIVEVDGKQVVKGIYFPNDVADYGEGTKLLEKEFKHSTILAAQTFLGVLGVPCFERYSKGFLADEYRKMLAENQ